MSEPGGQEQGSMLHMPSPESIGFRVVEGFDTHAATVSPDASLDKIAGIAIDKTVDRKTRWESSLRAMGQVVQDKERHRAVITQLADYARTFETKTEEDDLDYAEKDVVDYVRRVVANVGNPGILKRVLTHGSTDGMQDAIAKTGTRVESHFAGDSDVTEVILSSVDLAREVYAQEHGGHGYQTEEQKSDLATARERVKNITIK
jgi:hypothetical protein